ncbi:MAG: Tn3 family transposase, partial [Candidatus Nanopelagicales bacterium]|nr:Tn3 family transposase [Candidatus Nanopelagicales bacterium]
GKAMVAALDRIEEVSGLAVDPGAVAVVPARRVAELARWGMSGKAPALRRHPSSRRLATLLATVVQLQTKATDDALELFDVLMTNDLMARAQRQSKADSLRRYPRLSRDAAICATAAAVLLDAADSGEDVTIATVWHAIEQVVSRKDLAAAVAGITAVTPPPDADPGGAWRASIVERYAVVRRFLPKMCAVIDFGSTPATAPTLKAFQGLPELMATKPTRRVPASFLPAADVDLNVVPTGWWQPLVMPQDRPDGTVHRSAYVFCVLEQFHQALRRRDIYATTSSRWADPQAKLLTGSAWVQARRPVLNALQLPDTADGLLAEHTRALDDSWCRAADRLGSGDASIDGDGRLHTAKLDAIPDPPSLVDLRTRCQAMLPRVDVADVILEVMAWQPRFVDAFTAVSGGRTRLADLHLSIAAALTAHALNIGFTPVVSSGVTALTRDRISHVDQNYLRTETYAAANAPLIDAQADIDLAQIWGGGLVAAVDGIRFVVPVRSIDARPNPKYFGRGRGATLLNLVNDHAVGIAGMVLSGTPRDSLHVIDLLYRQDGGTRPEVIISDTGSYSDMVFGLLHLLGFDYRPQLADLPDTKLWRIDPAADYGPVNAAARGRIDTDRISTNWSEILRIVASIHTGTVSAHDVIRMLAHGGKPTRVGDALAHYGRTFKTMHVLSDIDDGTYRRQIKTMRNLQEGRHDLARHLFHGRKGQLRESYRQGMEEQMGALGLVLNCITLWNTVYLDAIIKQLRADGYPVDDQGVARLSPYVRSHINVHGHYAFQSRTASALRPLSTPADHECD